MHSLSLTPLLTATWQTIYMVFVSSFISIFAGLAVGVVLFLTRKQQALSNKGSNQVIGIIVNIVRSIPFIILLIAIIPLTRLIVGTSIGTNAAIVPLTIAAIPFFARIAETAFTELPSGLIETANAMGASTWQIVSKFLIPEALPALIKGGTLTVIGLIGYSAMAGAIGGGGLGELAINYGYQRFDVLVMIETVVILVVIVQLIQSFGDYLANIRNLKWALILSVILWIASIGAQVWPTGVTHKNTIRVGITTGVQQQIMKVAQRVALEKYHLYLAIVPFDDYVQPNVALNDGEISANIFQHVPYLDAQIKSRGCKLTPIAKTFIYPMGFYSRKIHSMQQLKNNSIVAIPNDPSNEGRALLLLQKAHLIKLKKGSGLFGTVKSIVQNPKHLHFIELDAAQLPRVLKDASLVALTNDFVKPAGFTVSQALLKESKDSPYANVIVVRTKDKNNPIFKGLIEAMHSKAVVKATEKAFPSGAAIPAW